MIKAFIPCAERTFALCFARCALRAFLPITKQQQLLSSFEGTGGNRAGSGFQRIRTGIGRFQALRAFLGPAPCLYGATYIALSEVVNKKPSWQVASNSGALSG